MNVLIAGASGFVGGAVSRALGKAGHHVVALSRTNGCDFREHLTPATWLPYLDGVDAVINCVGIIGERSSQRFDVLHTQAPLALFHACAQIGVRRVIQVSALGADETAFSAYHLSKRAADDALRAMDLDWFILRPSLIYGPGGGSAELFMRCARLPRIPVIAGGTQWLQPVHISDVVETARRCLDAEPPRQTLDIVGPETVSFSDWLQRMRCAQGLPPAATFSVSYGTAMALSRVVGCFHPLFRRENLMMLRKGYRADVEGIRQFLGRLPLAAEPSSFFSETPPNGSQS